MTGPRRKSGRSRKIAGLPLRLFKEAIAVTSAAAGEEDPVAAQRPALFGEEADGPSRETETA
jgi:hypothetical protein